MEYEIIFCKDGILRLRFGKKPLIPLHTLQLQEQLDDFSFIVNFWEYDCYFEDGLTIGGFLKCISPWTEFFSKLTRKNIQSYIDEMYTPIPSEQKNSIFDYVTLSYITHVENKVEYQTTDLDLNNIQQWFNSKREFTISDAWDLNSMYMLNGYNKNQEEHYSLSGSKMNGIADVPLFLESKHFIIFYDYKAKEKFGENYDTFQHDAKGVKYIKSANYDYGNTYLESTKQHNLQDIIKGFFKLLHTSTHSRDEFYQCISFELEQLDREHKIARENLDKESNNVISIDFSSQKNKDKIVFKNNEENKSSNVVSLNNNTKTTARRSTIKDYFIEQEEFFDSRLDLLPKTEILKIGKINPGIPPQTRIGPIIRD